MQFCIPYYRNIKDLANYYFKSGHGILRNWNFDMKLAYVISGLMAVCTIATPVDIQKEEILTEIYCNMRSLSRILKMNFTKRNYQLGQLMTSQMPVFLRTSILN